MTSESASAPASCSFTTTGSARVATSCGSAAYGAALTTTRAPREWASRRLGHGGQRDLELGEQDVARREPVQGGEVLVVDVPVGPGDDDDGVLPFGVDAHPCLARRLPMDDPHGGDVDAASLEPREVAEPVVIVAHAADHRHPCPRGRGCHGLVGALAAGQPAQRSDREHRLAGPGWRSTSVTGPR